MQGPLHRGQRFLQVAYRWSLGQNGGSDPFFQKVESWAWDKIQGLDVHLSGLLGWYYWLQRGAVRRCVDSDVDFMQNNKPNVVQQMP